MTKFELISNDYLLLDCECIPVDTVIDEWLDLNGNTVPRRDLLHALNDQFPPIKDNFKVIQLAAGLIAAAILMIIIRGLI